MRSEESSIHSYLIYSGNEEGRWRKAEEIGTAYLLDGKKKRLERVFFNHPDVLIVEPDPDSKSSAITINQVRELGRKINLKPYQSDFKVAIVKEAQRMTKEAQNALLKTLEEPPVQSVIILTVPHPTLLLPTVVSRCRKVALASEIEIDRQSASHTEAVSGLFSLLKSDRKERLFWLEEKKKEIGDSSEAMRLLDSWTSVLRDLFLIEEGLEGKILNRALACQKYLDTKGKVLEMTERILTLRRLLATTNVSPRLALENLLLELPTAS